MLNLLINSRRNCYHKWLSLTLTGLVLILIPESSTATSSTINKHFHRYKEHARYKRQFDASTASQIDLNITVPYIFSARLYGYGPTQGDKVAQSDPQALRLQTPLYFIERSYDTIYIHRDGVISLTSDFDLSPAILPLSSPLIALYWMRTRGGRVYYRESTDPNILNLAQSEVNIQYRYGNDFQTKSVVIITWEDTMNEKEREEKSKNSNVFQIALIIGDNACFAHFVYSRLAANGNAIAGFNGVAEVDSATVPEHFSLPGSGTSRAAQLLEKSNIGIPGEWLFRVDEERIYLCGAGFQGLECVDSCSPTQWYLDCARQCHCLDGNACNSETGECPDTKCSPGWEGAPICDQDVDECTDPETNCPSEQPDCVNTPGAYLCLCFEYENATNTCKGSQSLDQTAETIPVPVMPLVPSLASASTPRAPNRGGSGKKSSEGGSAHVVDEVSASSVQKHSHPSLIIKPPPRAPPTFSAAEIPTTTASPFEISDGDNGNEGVFEILPNESPAERGVVPPLEGAAIAGSIPADTSKINLHFASPNPANPPAVIVSTLLPMTIRPSLGTRPQKPNTPLFTATTSFPPPPPLLLKDQCAHCHQMAQCSTQGRCVCVPGWSGDGQTCEDVNECQSPSACGLHAECQNTVGSYQCVCDVGFIATVNGCVDVDECTEGLVQCPGGNSSMCVNTMGGYECQCRSGFTGQPTTKHGCVDIDECELSSFYCGDKARCVNTMGSFACECFEGYEYASKSATTTKGLAMRGSGAHCVDMDECVHSPCDRNAVCTNLDGTFQCECLDGFTGNGIECRETMLFPVAKNATVVSDATLPIQLDVPIIVFSKSYSSIYVSPFGLVSFDQPLSGMIRSAPSELRTAALLPFHLAFNPTTSGAVTLQQLSGGANKNDQLVKASLTVQSKFNVQDFQATALYIITFSQMREINLEKSNTFQVLLVKGVDNSTFAIFLYESVDSTPRGVAGVASPHGFARIPTDASPASHSNVGQRGKWIFRVDGASTRTAVACPAGRMGAPFCEQDCPAGIWGFECANTCHCEDDRPCDSHNGFCSNSKCANGFSGFNCSVDVDECSAGTNKCDGNATCQNTLGSYTCRCKADFRGNGFACEAVDRCLLRFGVTCALNSHCDTQAVDLPECVCNEGFHGDGRRECLADDLAAVEHETPETKTTTLLTTTTSTTTNAAGKSHHRQHSQSETDDSFVANNRLGGDKREHQQKRPGMPPKSSTNHSAKPGEMGDDLNENIITTKTESETSTDSSGMLLILGPIVFCIVWLVLVIVFLAICFYKRRRTRAEKYTPQMMGWSPRDYTSTRNSYFSQFTYT